MSFIQIDKNLTDSNVESRKNRNINDNIFVLGAVVNAVAKQEAEPIDVWTYDITNCFYCNMARRSNE